MANFESTLSQKEIVEYYSREDVLEKMMSLTENREIVGRKGDSYGKRPSIVQYPSDFIDMAKQGFSSFHFSIERWSSPSMLKPGLTKEMLAKLRIGWDLLIDVDTKNFLAGKICCKLILELLKSFNIKSISLKFSGNCGWHIGIPFEAFPTFNKAIAYCFPEAPIKIINYIRNEIALEFGKQLERIFKTAEDYADAVGMKVDDVYLGDTLNPYLLVNIDTVAVTSRHLIRMPYSLNEKSWLVSLPIPIDRISTFKREDASIDRITCKTGFLDPPMDNNEALALIRRAYATKKVLLVTQRKKSVIKPIKPNTSSKDINPELFPPCIKNILTSKLDDGRKRAEFVLRSFLGTLGFNLAELRKMLLKWNANQLEPLSEQYLESMISWQRTRGTGLLCPNCDKESFYKEILVKLDNLTIPICQPDTLCSKIKNPLSYINLKESENVSKKRKNNNV
jgi:hypothetical protein